MPIHSRQRPIPPEILYDMVKNVLRDYFHHYILDDDKPSWNALINLLLVSRLFHDTTNKILSHVFKAEISDNAQRVPWTPRVILDDVRKHARLPHGGGLVSYKTLVEDPTHSFSYARKLPFVAAYLVYLNLHNPIRELREIYAKDTFMDETAGQLVFYQIAESVRLPLIMALGRDCEAVIPSGFCDCIGRLLAEEQWLFDAFWMFGTMSPTIQKMSRVISQSRGKGSAEHILGRLDEGFKATTNQLTSQEGKLFLDKYGIDQERVDELTRQALCASGLAQHLKRLLEIPELQGEDTFGDSERARLILEKWGPA